MAWLEFLNGHIDGKCHLIWTLRNKLRKCGILKIDHPNVIFNGNTEQNSANQKHPGLILGEKLTFDDHIASKLTTLNTLTSTLRKTYHYIPRNSRVTIYKSFVRLHLAYTDVIFDKPSNATFSNQI